MIEIKEIITLLTYTVALAGMWFKLGNRVSSTEKSLKTLTKVIFKENGELGFITLDRCREQKESLQRVVDMSDKRYEDLQKEIKELSNNVLIIMVHLNVDSEKAKKRGLGNG